MSVTWTPDELQRIGGAPELEIASRRADGVLRRWVLIRVVSTGGQVYVRTWYRRETGWFGQVWPHIGPASVSRAWRPMSP